MRCVHGPSGVLPVLLGCDGDVVCDEVEPGLLQTEVGPSRQDGDAMGLAGVQRMWWIVAWSGPTGPGMLGPKSEVWA